MGLNRCTVCEKVTPEPDMSFCSDGCCETWTSQALEELREIESILFLDAKLEDAALRVVREARRTGRWH